MSKHMRNIGQFDNVGDLAEFLSTLKPEAKLLWGGTEGCSVLTNSDESEISLDDYDYGVENNGEEIETA